MTHKKKLSLNGKGDIVIREGDVSNIPLLHVVLFLICTGVAAAYGSKSGK
jgi:hypothetical protein